MILSPKSNDCLYTARPAVRHSDQAQNTPAKNVLLAHGARADGSGWKGVYHIFVKDGYNVSIVQKPETSFKEDVAATARVLAQQEGPRILVAQSYGGSVITEVGIIRRLSVWCISQPTCLTRERTRRTTESVYR